MASLLLENSKFNLTIDRLCFQLIENHGDFSNSAIIGLQPRGVYLSRNICRRLVNFGKNPVTHGSLDITFYRDDFRRREIPLLPQQEEIDFIIEGKNIVLVDDVLYTGRTIRAALDALGAYGRPGKVELLVLVDRRFSRQLPIEPDYVGIQVDSRASEKVKVEWEQVDGENKVWIFDRNKS
jgi:pyrimidine operon attenuation protein / uracil phosphoribosyltransferase